MAVVMASSNAIREEYLSSLADLDQNSKPMIDMLTMLAEDHRQHAPIIVDAIKQRISQVLHFFVFYGYCVISYYYLVRELICHCLGDADDDSLLVMVIRVCANNNNPVS